MNISFYAKDLGKTLTGEVSEDRGIVTVTSSDGRRKTTQRGGSPVEVIARLLLRDLERERTD